MNSGWNTANARFMEYVEERNIAEGDANEFFVEDDSLLTVSKYSGNHHNIVRQAVKPGKAFSIDTSFYSVKVYTDFVLFQTGKIDFAALVDKMYKSIEENRFAALYTAFMSMDASLPTDMVTDLSEVIAQLTTIAGKLDNIVSVSQELKNSLAQGLNVNSSVEEVTKLTDRVKELESELEKVKTSSGNQRKDTVQVGSESSGICY